jgi:hypothetical protein
VARPHTVTKQGRVRHLPQKNESLRATNRPRHLRLGQAGVGVRRSGGLESETGLKSPTLDASRSRFADAAVLSRNHRAKIFK